MSKEWRKAQEKSHSWWWKVPLILILLLAIALIAVVLNINSIALSQINAALEKSLSAGGSLDSFNLQITEGQLVLSGLTLNPPEGFGDAAPFHMKDIKVSVETNSLLDQEIIINEVTLNELAITLVRDTQGQLSFMHLLSERKDKSTDSHPKSDAKEPLSVPAVRVESIRINDLTLQVVDHLIGEKWTASVALNLAVDNLQLSDLMSNDIALNRLNVALSQLNIDPLPGFGQTPLLSLDEVSLTANNLSLKAPHMAFNRVMLKGLALSVEQDAEKLSNLEKLISSWVPNKTLSNSKSPVKKPVASKTVPSFSINDVQLDSISAQVLSYIEPQPWRTGFERLDIQLTQLGIAGRKITLNSADFNLEGIEVDQAPGFGDSKLLRLEQLSIVTDQIDTGAGELSIKKIALQDLSSSIQTNASGLSNIQALSNALSSHSNEIETTTQHAPEVSPSATQKPLPTINIEHFLLNKGSLTYSDAAIVGKLMTFPLSHIELEAKQLRLFDNNPQAAPASLSLSLELKQPESLPNAYLGAIAVMGPVNSAIPAVNAQVRLMGFKLDTIDPLIPPSSRTALGADGFDAAVAIALNHKHIDLKTSVLSDKNIGYNAIAVKGPITAPKIEMGAILAGVYSRFSDGLLNVGKDGLNAGLDIASSSVDIVQTVGSGTVSIGKNLGVSLFEAGTGLVTLDHQKLTEGLVHSSKGSLDIGLESAEKSGSAAKGGIKGSYSSLDGSNELKAWNEGIQSRYEHSMQKAEGALLQMPYPPETQ